MQTQKILIVEDEESLAIGIEYNLREEGYEVTLARDGKQALEEYDNDIFDLIILDIMLPYHNGFEIAEYIRKKDPRIPLLALTAKSKNEDKVKGLEIGLDDYLTKPFYMKELLLRINRMLERKEWYRKESESKSIYAIDDIQIDFSNLTCTKNEETFSLTQNEMMLLKYLIDREGNIVSRKELLENVWNINPEIETRTVDIFISRLRKYLEDDPSAPKYIKSVRGAGYIFGEE